jgi:CheY-like chemotaxis protein
LLTRPGQVLSLESLSEGWIAATLNKPTRLAALREAVVHAVEGTHFAEEPPRAAVLDPTLALRLPARILVVDGDAMTRTLLNSILRGYGYCPETARNGAEARQSLAAEEPLGIVFLDTGMGDFDAVEATRQLRLRERERSRSHREIPPSILVAMNESDREDIRRKFLSVGMDDYLAKPPTVETVLNIVENWAPMVPGRRAVPPLATEPAPAAEAGKAGKAEMRPGGMDKLTMIPENPLALDDTGEAMASGLPAEDPLGIAPGPGDGLGADASNPPVDFKLLLESANGDWNGLFELIDLYLDQTEHRFEQLITAISLGNAQEIEALARSGAGASATCGVTNLIKPLTDLQNLARAGDLERAEIACSEAIQEYERLRAFLDRQRKLRLNLPT